MNFGHVKWFVEDPTSLIPEITTVETLFITLFVVIGIFIASLTNDYIKKQQPIADISDKLQPLRGWMPTVIRVILGLMLAYSSKNLTIFVPNLSADTDLALVLLIATSILSGTFILGLATRASSIILMLTFLVAVLNFGLPNLLDHIEIIGLSLFLLIEGPGKWALDNIILSPEKYPLKYRRHSMRIILVSAGISFATLAFSEKLADLNLAMTFLNDHNWNFLSLLGISDRNFILFIGASELTIGLALILGLASRAVVLLLLVLLTITALLLGISEVVGHAFAIAVVASAWLNNDLPLMKSRQR